MEQRAWSMEHGVKNRAQGNDKKNLIFIML
jgi:hypothetical protein